MKYLTVFKIFKNNGLGWYFKEILSLEIHTVDYKPIKESSHRPNAKMAAG